MFSPSFQHPLCISFTASYEVSIRPAGRCGPFKTAYTYICAFVPRIATFAPAKHQYQRSVSMLLPISCKCRYQRTSTGEREGLAVLLSGYCWTCGDRR